MEKLLINTPQVVQIEYNLASIAQRFLALAVDVFIMALYGYVVIFYVLGSQTFVSGRLETLVYVSVLLPIMCYHLVLESLLDGQTPGKKLMKLKVVRLDGGRASLYEYFVRWSFNIVELWMFSGAIAALTIILSNKSQRLGDIAAGTAVISLRPGISLEETVFEELAYIYQPVFPEYQLNRLSDEDINIIKDAYKKALKKRDAQVMNALADKISEVTEIDKGNYRDRDFVDLVLKEHYHFHSVN